MSLISTSHVLASQPVLATVSDDDEGIGAGGAVLLTVIVIALVALFIAALVSIVRTPASAAAARLCGS